MASLRDKLAANSGSTSSRAKTPEDLLVPSPVGATPRARLVNHLAVNNISPGGHKTDGTARLFIPPSSRKLKSEVHQVTKPPANQLATPPTQPPKDKPSKQRADHKKEAAEANKNLKRALDDLKRTTDELNELTKKFKLSEDNARDLADRLNRYQRICRDLESKNSTLEAERSSSRSQASRRTRSWTASCETYGS